MTTVSSALASPFCLGEPSVHKREEASWRLGPRPGDEDRRESQDHPPPPTSTASEITGGLRMQEALLQRGAGLLPGDPQNRVISCSSTLVELPAAAASPGRGRLVKAGTT